MNEDSSTSTGSPLENPTVNAGIPAPRTLRPRRSTLAGVLLAGILCDILLLAYGMVAHPASRGASAEDLLLEALLVILLFLYLYAALYGTREYDRVDHWIHRQGLVFGLAVGAMWAGEVLNSNLGDTVIFGSLRTVQYGLYRAIGATFIAAVPVLILLAAGLAARKTGQLGAGVRVGLWSGLTGGLVAVGILLVMTYLFMGALQGSPSVLNGFTASREPDIVAYLVKDARIAGTAYLALAMLLGAGLGAIGGLVGRRLARLNR